AEVEAGTIYLTAADRWGNMASFISSVYSPFGSGVAVPDYGFTLQNRGGLFSLEREHPNVVEPRKRPFQTIIPAFVTKDDEPVLSFGNMGGSMQPQGQVQELVNIIDVGMNVQAAGDAARFRHDQTSNIAEIESNLYELVGAELEDTGHDLKRTDGTPMGGYQAIMFVPDRTHRTMTVPIRRLPASIVRARTTEKMGAPSAGEHGRRLHEAVAVVRLSCSSCWRRRARRSSDHQCGFERLTVVVGVIFLVCPVLDDAEQHVYRQPPDLDRLPVNSG